MSDLKPAALACLCSQAQLASSTAQTVTVRLPVDLLDEATRVKRRMLKVCAYHFAEDTPLGAEVADIRLGTGYLDWPKTCFAWRSSTKSKQSPWPWTVVTTTAKTSRAPALCPSVSPASCGTRRAQIARASWPGGPTHS
ncbi:MAG: hypothetical protein QM758_27555 [Armatimonas sp.]